MFSLRTILEVNKAEEAKQGKMVALFIPPVVGDQIQHMFSDVDGDNIESNYMHITLGMGDFDELSKPLIKKIVETFAKKIEPFNIEMNGFDIFPSKPNDKESKPVLFAKINSDNLFDLHKKLFKVFDKFGIKIDNGGFDFKPHCTVKYLNEPADANKDFKRIVPIKKISYCEGEDRTDFNLG